MYIRYSTLQLAANMSQLRNSTFRPSTTHRPAISTMTAQWDPYDILKINPQRQQCYGKSSGCGNLISKKDREKAPRLINSISLLSPQSAAMPQKLVQLASLILCKGVHTQGKAHSQVDEVTAIWQEDIDQSIADAVEAEDSVMENQAPDPIQLDVASIRREVCAVVANVFRTMENERRNEQAVTAQMILNEQHSRDIQQAAYDRLVLQNSQLFAELQRLTLNDIARNRTQGVAAGIPASINESVAVNHVHNNQDDLPTGLDTVVNATEQPYELEYPVLRRSMSEPAADAVPTQLPSDMISHIDEGHHYIREEVSASGVRRRALDEFCLICKEAVDLESPDDVVWCQATCGHNSHRGCMATWAEYCVAEAKPVTCVLCRSSWAGDL
jgi:hypothetical protein